MALKFVNREKDRYSYTIKKDAPSIIYIYKMSELQQDTFYKKSTLLMI